MGKKIRRMYVQQRIFDDDEVFIVSHKHRPPRYDEYIQGARDMLFKHLGIYGRETMKNLPRIYMSALIKVLFKDKTAFYRFATGEKVLFNTTRDAAGKVIAVQVIFKANKHDNR